MPAAPVELPEEIWRYVCSYLGNSVWMWRLHGLNRLFRQIALDYRFREYSLNIADLKNADYIEKILFLGEDAVRHRVRELSIGTLASSRLSDEEDEKEEELFRSKTLDFKYLARFQKIHGTQQIGRSQALTTMISSLTNVAKVHLYAFYHNEGTDILRHLPLLSAAMQTYSSHLTSISFAICSYDALTKLLTTFPTLTRLENFSINFFEESWGSSSTRPRFAALLKNAVIPFLDRHRSTIAELHISCQSFPRLSLLYFFDAFPDVTNLRHIAVHFSSRNVAMASALGRLLKRHQQTLEGLTLTLPAGQDMDDLLREGEEVAEDDLLLELYDEDIRLKKVHIETSVHTPFRSSPNITEYAARYKDHLTSFEMSRRCFSISDWTRLSAVRWSRLVEMRIGLQNATPSVFDLLAANFPELRTLTISVWCFSYSVCVEGRYNHSEDLPVDESEFPIQMAGRCYLSSRLDDIYLQDNANRAKNQLVTFTLCVKAVVEAFPTVAWVNSKLRDTFLVDGELGYY